MKVRYEILHTEYYDEEGKTAFVGLFFDAQEFLLDKEDLVAIDDISKTVFDRMVNIEEAIHPIENREKIMNEVSK